MNVYISFFAINIKNIVFCRIFIGSLIPDLIKRLCNALIGNLAVLYSMGVNFKMISLSHSLFLQAIQPIILDYFKDMADIALSGKSGYIKKILVGIYP